MVDRKFGWKKDVYDPRDYEFTPTLMASQLPKSVDLREHMPPVWDQGQLGACTAFAITAAYQYLSIKNGSPIDLSRLFLYYNERAKENSIHTDAGAQIRTGMKVMAKIGCCQEKLEPYIEVDFDMLPAERAYKDAKNHESIKYHRVKLDLYCIKSALAEGLPPVFGAKVFKSFMSDEVAATGIIPMPEANEPLMGGHAIILVGYDDAKEMFLVRNSWNTTWGIDGYFWLPYAYVTNSKLCNDMWIIQTIKNTVMNQENTTIKTTAEIAALSPIEIIQLVTAGLAALMNVVQATGPWLHWRKEEQDAMAVFQQQLAAVSKLGLDNAGALVDMQKQIDAIKKYVDDHLPPATPVTAG